MKSTSTTLIKSTSIIAIITMLSRVMGFLRDIVLAQVFGAGPAFDAFVVAFKIPNFLRRLFGEGAYAQALVPMLTTYQTPAHQAQEQHFINRLSTAMFLLSLVIILGLELAAPIVVFVLAPGFIHKAGTYVLTLDLLRIIFPYFLLISLAALFAAILNSYQRFALPTIAAVLLNISLITMALVFASYFTPPIYALAWGVIIGGMLQLAVQLPALKKINLLPAPTWPCFDAEIWTNLKRLLPALIGVSVGQISILLDNIFASFLPAGSISWLYYSDRITYLPLAVIGVALVTVVLPSLSRQFTTGSRLAFAATLDWALRCAILLGVPASAALFMLSNPIVATLIYHGAFTSQDSLMTSKSLAAYALGLPAAMVIKLLAAGFYAQHKIRQPLKIAAIAIAFNLLLNALLIFPLAHVGLALSTALTAWLNAILLLSILIKRQLFQLQPGWLLFLGRVIFAVAIMMLGLWLVNKPQNYWLSAGLMNKTMYLFFLIGFGAGIFFIVLRLLGLRFQHFKFSA